MKGFWKDFKAFISRGNIMSMAIGVIIGAAFSAIVTALTNNIIRPFINWILMAITGTSSLSSVYTFLQVSYLEDGITVDLANSIYIDWGAFITAILDFLIIAFTLFLVMRILMRTQGFIQKNLGELPNKAERKELKKQGVNLKNYKETIAATAKLRESNKPEEAKLPPTQEELLSDILTELKKQNANTETKPEEQK